MLNPGFLFVSWIVQVKMWCFISDLTLPSQIHHQHRSKFILRDIKTPLTIMYMLLSLSVKTYFDNLINIPPPLYQFKGAVSHLPLDSRHHPAFSCVSKQFIMIIVNKLPISHQAQPLKLNSKFCSFSVLAHASVLLKLIVWHRLKNRMSRPKLKPLVEQEIDMSNCSMTNCLTFQGY